MADDDQRRRFEDLPTPYHMGKNLGRKKFRLLFPLSIPHLFRVPNPTTDARGSCEIMAQEVVVITCKVMAWELRLLPKPFALPFEFSRAHLYT